MSFFSFVEVFNYTQSGKSRKKEFFYFTLPLQNVINKHSYQIGLWKSFDFYRWL